MILVDSNIIMYAAGAEHPKKTPCIAWLDKVAGGRIDATIDAEVLQEILHRYRAIRRWADGRKVYDLARTIFPVVIPVGSEVLDRSRELMDRYRGLAARDALHAAVVAVHDLDGICSFDKDFDVIRKLKRIEPKISTAR